MVALNWSCMSHYGNYLLLITYYTIPFMVFEDSGELTAFVELASISAGENTMDIDKVCCFRDAVSAAAPIIYQLCEQSGFEELLKAITKLGQALGSDTKLEAKLVSLNECAVCGETRKMVRLRHPGNCAQGNINPKTTPKRHSGLLHYKARDVLVNY